MSPPTLRQQVPHFREHLKSVKDQAALPEGVSWYPWNSLAGLEMLDRMLGGNASKLARMIGSDPVLDIGCGDGDVAFFLESLGHTVDAVDYAATNYNHMLGVHTLKQHLRSGIGIHTVDLDTRPHLPKANYGLCIMLGVLYHLKNPFLLLETLARHSRHILLSTRIASFSPDKKVNFGGLPVAYLVDDDELNHDRTNFWIFSEEGFKRIVRRSGWNVTHYASNGSGREGDPVSSAGDVRAFILAQSRYAAAASNLQLEQGWHRAEEGHWRWTARKFSVRLDLALPLAPATLRFVFHIPEVWFQQHPALTMSARINGIPLAPMTFSTPGEHEFVGELPQSSPGPVTAEFELDRALAHTGADERELGVLVDFSGATPVLVSSRGLA